MRISAFRVRSRPRLRGSAAPRASSRARPGFPGHPGPGRPGRSSEAPAARPLATQCGSAVPRLIGVRIAAARLHLRRAAYSRIRHGMGLEFPHVHLSDSEQKTLTCSRLLRMLRHPVLPPRALSVTSPVRQSDPVMSSDGRGGFAARMVQSTNIKNQKGSGRPWWPSKGHAPGFPGPGTSSARTRRAALGPRPRRRPPPKPKTPLSESMRFGSCGKADGR